MLKINKSISFFAKSSMGKLSLHALLLKHLICSSLTLVSISTVYPCCSKRRSHAYKRPCIFCSLSLVLHQLLLRNVSISCFKLIIICVVFRVQNYCFFRIFAKSFLVQIDTIFANVNIFLYLCSVFQSVKFKQAHTEKVDNCLLFISGKRTRRGDRFSATKLQLFFEICKFSVQIFAEKNKKVENLCKRPDLTLITLRHSLDIPPIFPRYSPDRTERFLKSSYPNANLSIFNLQLSPYQSSIFNFHLTYPAPFSDAYRTLTK